MKLFSRFFRKASPAVPSVDERIAAVRTGSEDHEEVLRVAAIAELPDGDSLRALAGLSGLTDGAAVAVPAAVKRAAQARMAQLIEAGSVDPMQVARLVVEGSSSRLRQLAAEAVEDPAQLRQLLKQVRNKDKSVYKILKQKCDALNAADRRAAEIAGEASALCESLERHSQRPYDALYTSVFDQLNGRWDALTTQPAASIERRAAQAIDRCREAIRVHLLQVEQQAAQQAALDAARQAAEEIHEQAHRAAQAAALAEAHAEAQIRSEAAALREAQDALRAEQRAADEQLCHQIGGLIRKANGALNDGNTQRAAGLRRSIAEKLPALSSLPAYLTRHLQQLDDKLTELKQWKDYAVAPKRIELVDEMEALIGSTEEPKVLAERIKALQQEWRTISKGIVSDAPAEWERFHQAASAAYQPCRDYFEAQAELRRENLKNRTAVLERLTAFETAQTAENTDWRLLASVLHEAPREWRRYFAVDREAGRALQVEFDAALGRLQARLDAWYERNVADKQALIKRARHLLTLEDSREAIEAVKRLQILWKATSPVPRDQDQTLWSEFRELCDAVHQKRQQAYAEYIAGLEANKLQAVALCEEAERVAALSGTDLLGYGAKISGWRTEFDALDEMPRAEARALQERFERALDLCKVQMARQQARDAEQSITDLFEAGRLINAYGWAVAGNAAASEQETLKQAAETFIAGVERWPRGGMQAVKDALARAGSSSAADGGAGETALRTLCIRCEIHSEMPTPPEDEALRREYQVHRLMHGMGQGVRADDGDWDALTLEWIRIAAVSPDAHDGLQRRFLRCRVGANVA